MSPQQHAELAFWLGEFAKYARPQEYVEVRQVRDLGHYAELLPEIRNERGRGMDLCCGLVSILGRLECERVYAVDALMCEYARIYTDRETQTIYMEADGENLTSFGCDSLDFVWCMNAVDHTPNPPRMLAEAHRILKPGGRFYFMVNFDPALYAPHHSLWTMRTVEAMLAKFKLLRGTQCWSETWSKYIYAGLYRKEIV